MMSCNKRGDWVEKFKCCELWQTWRMSRNVACYVLWPKSTVWKLLPGHEVNDNTDYSKREYARGYVHTYVLCRMTFRMTFLRCAWPISNIRFQYSLSLFFSCSIHSGQTNLYFAIHRHYFARVLPNEFLVCDPLTLFLSCSIHSGQMNLLFAIHQQP